MKWINSTAIGIARGLMDNPSVTTFNRVDNSGDIAGTVQISKERIFWCAGGTNRGIADSAGQAKSAVEKLG